MGGYLRFQTLVGTGGVGVGSERKDFVFKHSDARVDRGRLTARRTHEGILARTDGRERAGGRAFAIQPLKAAR